MNRGAVVIDALAVLVFVALGRQQHEESTGLTAILEIAAPFLLAVALGWIVARVWSDPFSTRTGLVVAAVVLVAGMVLRRTVFDRGTAAAFVIVAALVLGGLIVGWRAVARRLIGGGAP